MSSDTTESEVPPPTSAPRDPRDKNVGWYTPTISNLDASSRDLVENYARVPQDEVIPRLLSIRDETWEVFPFPCVGQFRFIELNLHLQDSYKRIIDRLQAGARYFDVGCCFAQDLRKLVVDGAPSDNMFGLEMHGGFVDIAYKFFGDKDSLKAKFVIGDLYDDSNTDLVALRGTADILHVGMFLHLWDLEGQTRACARLVEFLSPVPGSVVVGCSAGRVEAKEWFNPIGKSMFKHDVESFEKMWEEVGRRTSTSWKVRAQLSPGTMEQSGHWDDPLARRLVFEVERI
ncbi:hypothetical protein GQ53DRAFT_796072 [Thozetella sp. PMI_491]|nr:hypothetical protein GQ53DRAFT_796072 [Thozetella sp. PMI_491]